MQATTTNNKGRPLSICSISSAASSGSSLSANSSSSSGVQSSLTRNGSLNTNHHLLHHHHQLKLARGSAKLQLSPSSASSHSNTSSLFRDDGFEDDLTSNTSENLSTTLASSKSTSTTTYHQHNNNNSKRPSFHSTNTPGYWDSNLSITQRVITEIIETERTYVDDLEQIVTGYICYLRNVLKQQKQNKQIIDNAAIITDIHIKRLFSNLEEIYKINKDLLFALEECYLNPSAVAECFVENASGFKVYTHYCTMYPQVVSTLTELMANQASALLLKERQNELNQSLPLGAYLLKPVQRILKYHLLFQSLIKHTSDDESINEKDRLLISEAFSVMTNIASHINSMKKRHEHAIRVQEVQGLLSGWNGPDLTTLGELILEDTFKLFNKPKSSRHLFLFDNVLLFTKKKRDGSLCYKGHIACSNLMLIEKIEGEPLVFNTVPFDNPKALHAFQARNLDKKRDWCLQMKEVIIKSFEVKIPIHVRDILMGLTNSANSEQETTSSSPSTTTKSSSDTARLLKAPNYLEKRAKQQQDKKKQ